MVAVSPEQLRDEALAFFREPEVPASFSWVSTLAPLHLRLFPAELADALKNSMLTGDLNSLTPLVEGWEATAELDAWPEAAAHIAKPKQYRPLSELRV